MVSHEKLDINVGQKVFLTVDAEKMFLFDAQTVSACGHRMLNQSLLQSQGDFIMAVGIYQARPG